jgi:hypothetical protein
MREPVSPLVRVSVGMADGSTGDGPLPDGDGPAGTSSSSSFNLPQSRIGMTSFEPLLASLGLRRLLVVDEEATRRLKERLPPRNESYVRGAPSIVLTARFFKRIDRKGAQARIDNSTKEQRRKWARNAANARWQR